MCYYDVTVGVEQDSSVCVRARVCVDARTDGWMEGWSECVFEGEGGRGWPFDPLQQKTEMLSSNVSRL